MGLKLCEDFNAMLWSSIYIYEYQQLLKYCTLAGKENWIDELSEPSELCQVENIRQADVGDPSFPKSMDNPKQGNGALAWEF